MLCANVYFRLNVLSSRPFFTKIIKCFKSTLKLSFLYVTCTSVPEACIGFKLSKQIVTRPGFARIIIIIISLSQSTADIGLSNFLPSHSIFGYSHPAPTSTDTLLILSVSLQCCTCYIP
jgi:hypothetical protein